MLFKRTRTSPAGLGLAKVNRQPINQRTRQHVLVGFPTPGHSHLVVFPTSLPHPVNSVHRDQQADYADDSGPTYE